MKIQFILKRNEVYGFVSYTRRSSGLWNSTNFIVEAMRERGIDADIVEVRDNNDIDREVTRFKPDLVVIEALWVVPEKFDVLKKLHPKVRWFCHLHSEMPFLALEGIAMEWVLGYVQKGVKIIANSRESFDALRSFVGSEDIDYLPNVYRIKFMNHIAPPDGRSLTIACLGALRPMKNHLLQAMAAIAFAKERGEPLAFIVNSTRVETGGDPVLKNLRALFAGVPDAELVELHWMERDDMIPMIHNAVDLGMQVSLTETFNVVTADYVSAGIPIVVSKEVKWAHPKSKALDNSIEDIVTKMHTAISRRCLIKRNQRLLRAHQLHAEESWCDWVASWEFCNEFEV